MRSLVEVIDVEVTAEEDAKLNRLRRYIPLYSIQPAFVEDGVLGMLHVEDWKLSENRTKKVYLRFRARKKTTNCKTEGAMG